jgi:hypothetical protein
MGDIGRPQGGGRLAIEHVAQCEAWRVNDVGILAIRGSARHLAMELARTRRL